MNGAAPSLLRAVEGSLVELLGSSEEDAIRAVDVVLRHAIDNRASDVHLEPWEDCVSVRYRIDGLLHEVARLPIQHYPKILGRVKVVARMLTYQKDLPQDGRIDPEATACGKAMRVSTFPTVYGEKIVIRVLDADPSLFALDALGFRADIGAALRTIVGRPQGTLLLTGPASSGKTTTIYALLKEVIGARATATHVATIEDPVEYRLGHIAQTEVNPHVGFTFEAALRSLMRQDPEVIMIGEIRDVETARAAIQAGLTGHLVISTIHSGTAAGVFTRLLDMGVEPYLIASSVTGVLAQRLLRRNCLACAAPYTPDPATAARFGMAERLQIADCGLRIDCTTKSHVNDDIVVRSTIGDPQSRFMRGRGCDVCQGIGYRGRNAIGELLTVDETVANLILSRPRTFTVHEAALTQGMIPLAADGARCVCEGLTTIEELARVLPSDGMSAASA
ncbi:MAG: GspE/PulE family protein [Candidatus Hydrogenedentes bacterium]|nr:GspE/PulE family protein [Candidatus Hydrogenedentota bacterium]